MTFINWVNDAAGYSLGRYTDKQWQLIGDWLVAQGYSVPETVQILLSKHMRWAGDNFPATLKGFKKYYDNNTSTIRKDARMWAAEMKKEDPVTREKAQTIFLNVVNGVGNHGSFLRAFADAYMRADSENRALLHDAAVKLIEKYNLQTDVYLSE